MEVYQPNFTKRGGLVTVVAQDASTREILMVAYTDEAGYLETLKTGKAVYFSTSRNERWCKGETSGDFQLVLEVRIDCDGDALIYLVDQKGNGACHTKARSCFFREALVSKGFLMTAHVSEKDQLPTIEVPVHEIFVRI